MIVYHTCHLTNNTQFFLRDNNTQFSSKASNTQSPTYNYYSASCILHLLCTIPPGLQKAVVMTHEKLWMSHILLCGYDNLISHMMYNQLNTSIVRPKKGTYKLLPSSRKVSSIPAGQSLSCNRHVMCIRRKERAASNQMPIGVIARLRKIMNCRSYQHNGSLSCSIVWLFERSVARLKLVTRHFQTILK